jgi:hypothetical protein
MPEGSSGSANDDQVGKAIEQTRSTAKWIIAAFAAVGASLIAGLQLTGLGKLDDLDLAIAIAGLALALASVVVAVLMVARVLAPPVVLLDEVEKQIGGLVSRDETLLRGQAEDLSTLLTRYKAAYKNYVKLWNDAEANQGDTAKLAAAQASTPELERFEDTINSLRRLALSQKVKALFQSMLVPLILAVLGTTLGVAAYAYATNQPEDTANVPPHTSKAVGQTPVGVRLRLSRSERALLAPQLGRGCAGQRLWGLAIGGRPVALDVVTLPTPRCRSVRVVITPKAGILVHRSPLPRVARAERLQRSLDVNW